MQPLHPLYVVAVVSNQRRFRSRYDLYRRFAKHASDAGAELVTVELAFGQRPFELTIPDHPRQLQVRTGHEMWYKENLINLGMARLPADWRYAAWVDADVSFARPDWVAETVHQLQHHPVVQMFSEAMDLSPHHGPFQRHRGFAWSYQHHLATGEAYDFWHPGFAWAIRRDAFNDLGGLIDWAILGAGDHHMAAALVGQAESSCHGGVTAGYRRLLLQWQERAVRRLRKDLGYVDGLLLHHWHGRKHDRRYRERWDVLVRCGYDPHTDVHRDWQGLWQLTDHGDERSLCLRDGIRHYFQARNEDSIDLDESEVTL